MFSFKAFLFVIMLTIPFTQGQDVLKEDIELTITTEKPAATDFSEDPATPPVKNSDTSNTNNNNPPADTGVQRPSFGGNTWSPNVFQSLLNHFIKTTGKTYGPNIIAIIGDKPYISMEILHKFSPLRWLVNAFQGKIQNLCGFLSPPVQAELPIDDPHDIFGQLMQQGQRRPSIGSRQPIVNAAPVSVYDIAALYKNFKKSN